MIKELDLVVLNADPDHPKLHRGDVGTVVHVYQNGRAFEVEFADGGGTTIGLITLEADEVHAIGEGEVLHARRTA